MKMHDLFEAPKVPKIFQGADAAADAGKAEKGADAVSDAGKASKAGTSALDDLKYVANRMFGNKPKEPKVNAGSPTRIDPTIDELPPTTTVAPPKEKVKTPTAKPKKDAEVFSTTDKVRVKTDGTKQVKRGSEWVDYEPKVPKAKAKVETPPETKVDAPVAPAAPTELDDIVKNAGLPKAEPKVTAPDTPVTPTPVAEPAVTTPARSAPKSHEEMLADLQAELKATQQEAERAAIRKQIDTEKAAINPVAPSKSYADKASAVAANLDATSKVLSPAAELVKGGAKLGATGVIASPLVTNIGSDSYLGDVAKDYTKMTGYGSLWGPGTNKEKPDSQVTPDSNTDNQPALFYPDNTGLEKPETKPMQNQSVDFKDLLKLAGLKPITERDVTSGLVKAKPIMTLVENKNLNECGDMMSGMSSPNTPASLNISATAGSGEEVANMLKSIMQLAGVKPVTNDMMPAIDALPVIGDEAMSMGKAMDIMTASPEDELEFGDEDGIEVDVIDVAPDSMNDGDNMSVAQGDVDNDGDHDMADHEEEEETKEGFESATTKPDPTAMPGYGSWEQKFQRLAGKDMAYVPPGSGNNPLKKESTEVKESAPVIDTATTNLFKAYEAFKNGQ